MDKDTRSVSTTAHWMIIDIVAACLENQISLNFQRGKRFYRVRLKNKCGIFDIHSNMLLLTSDAIFSEAIEARYKYAGNNRSAMEALAMQCNPDMGEISSA